MLADLDMIRDMIGSVLAFARDDTKHEPRSLIDLSALVEGICHNASDAGEPVTFSGPRGATISGRPTALRRAVSNLVDNAVKYGRSAAVSLIPEAERVVITVEDEGPGTSRSEREKVFEPSYKIEGSRNPDTGGVGLGLSAWSFPPARSRRRRIRKKDQVEWPCLGPQFGRHQCMIRTYCLLMEYSPRRPI